MIQAETSIDILEWLDKYKADLIKEYTESKTSVRNMFLKYKQLRPDLNARQMRRVLEKTKKTSPRHFVVDDAYELAVSEDGIESSHLRKLMLQHFGEETIVVGKGIVIKLPKYSPKDYYEVTNNLRSKAQREGKKVRIVPTYLYKQSLEQLQAYQEELPKAVEAINKIKAESIKKLNITDLSVLESYSSALSMATTNSATNRGAHAYFDKQMSIIDGLIGSKTKK